MIKYLSILFFLLSTNAVFAAGICEETRQKEPMATQKTLDQSYNCRLQWKDAKGEHGVEIGIFRKYCAIIDGGELQDCMIARTCETDKLLTASSIPVILFPELASKFCDGSDDYFLIGEDDDQDVKVYVNCIKGIAQHIVLQSPKGKKKLCQLPK